MRNSFDNIEVALILQKFVGILSSFFEKRLVSVVLYGSIVFDDLAPGYGDLDFLAVVEEDLSEAEQRGLVELRNRLRRENPGVLAQMVEGAFLPRRMLDPAQEGNGFWWGTSGDRPWEMNRLGWLVLHVIKERGKIIYGEDIRSDIPAAPREGMVKEVREFTENVRKRPLKFDLHAVDPLLTAARLLLWLKEGRLSSKTEAADWGYISLRGEWRKHLPKARDLRLNPKAADQPEYTQWLTTLAEPIFEACEEVETELRTHL